MDIVEKAESYVFHSFKDKLSPDYIYHNFNHTLRVVNNAKLIAKEEGVSTDDIEIITLAAWFHDLAYIEGPDGHELRSSVMAKDFLTESGYDANKAEAVATLIRATQLGVEPQNHLEKIIKDADCSHFAEPNYVQLAELLREEWKITQKKEYTDLEWAISNRKVLLHYHRFFTEYAKTNLQPQKEANIAALQVCINDLEYGKKKTKDKAGKKKQEKPERPERGIDTMFRVTLNNHTRLSEIADSKANILLSVNAIIISIALSTLIPKLDAPGNAHLIGPTFIMMLFSTVSIVFAILSTRPKVTTGTFTRKDVEDRKVNLLFFGNFYKMPLDEYEWAVNDLMKERDYLYNAMIKDLYFLGKVLNRKYNLLRITYNIFMVGIILSVVAFVVAFQTL
ncbi:HD domain-containing protein [Flavobacterium sp. Sd200]|uniref:Pycsar system effector family protein n=1 Tax=Flavobacterium sp. Sd200 TaxID=2692211 RepID=UPI001368A78F|nr:Pycsar system effector family protein [Flavobacterium sp. Sd200]MXN89897.1 HD domain-containing protein [Flavobacterium sp. Sd200]